MKKPLLITIVGPTAVGKTSIAIQLAKELRTIILSADSRQFFRETSIGTAKPSSAQLSEVPHYFIDHLSIHDFYSVGDFERDALAFLSQHFLHSPYALAVGGSGLYINALTQGLDELPQVPESLREEIMQEVEMHGLDPLVKELETNDPAYFEAVDKNNVQRIVRAIEVFRHTGHPISSFWGRKPKERPFDLLSIGITAERNALYATIDNRVDEMMAAGLEEEAKKLYVHKDLYALQTVGYKELFDHFDGLHSLEEAVSLIKRNTRRYAKRQLTWFRKDLSTHWFQNNEADKIVAFVRNALES